MKGLDRFRGVGGDMVRKRYRRKRSKAKTKSEDNTCLVSQENVSIDNEDIIDEEAKLMESLGLPKAFGSQATNGPDADKVAYAPVAEESDKDQDDYYEDEQFEVEVQKPKKKKKKTQAKKLQEFTSESRTWSVDEFLTAFPNGLNLNEDPSLSPRGHIIFEDAEGECEDEGEEFKDQADSTVSNLDKVETESVPADESLVEDPSNTSQAESIAAEDPAKVPEDNQNNTPLLSSSPAAPNLQKYYHQRYDFFHLFDEGCQIDHEGWYSVTPEKMAAHIARRRSNHQDVGVVWDAFGGVGGNSIQYALAGNSHVICTELDGERVKMCKHNAKIYNADPYIDFIQADSLRLPAFWRSPITCNEVESTKTAMFDCVFLSPPWGGPQYLMAPVYDPFTMMGVDFATVIKNSHLMSREVVYFIPRNTELTSFIVRLREILAEAGLKPISTVEVETLWMDDRLKVVALYVK